MAEAQKQASSPVNLKDKDSLLGMLAKSFYSLTFRKKVRQGHEDLSLSGPLQSVKVVAISRTMVQIEPQRTLDKESIICRKHRKHQKNEPRVRYLP